MRLQAHLFLLVLLRLSVASDDEDEGEGEDEDHGPVLGALYALAEFSPEQWTSVILGCLGVFAGVGYFYITVFGRDQLEVEKEKADLEAQRWCQDMDPEPWIKQALNLEEPDPEEKKKKEEDEEGEDEDGEKGSSPAKSEGTQSTKTGGGEEEEEESPVFDLIRKGKVRAVEALCRTAAHLEARDKLDSTPVHVAAECGEEELVRTLARRNVDLIEERNYFGWTPLLTAVFHAQLPSIEALLESGAETQVVDNEGHGPLHLVALSPKVYNVHMCAARDRRNRSKRRMREFFQFQAEIAKNQKIKETMRKEIMRKIQVGEEVSARERRLSTGVRHVTEEEKFLTLWRSTPNAIEIIISARLLGDPYMRRSGQVRGNKTTVNVHVADKQGKTALHHAAAGGLKVLCSRLLDMQAKVNVKDGAYNTPLHWAVRGAAYEVVEMLLECKAEANAVNSLFNTPLHFAVEKKDKQIVSTLIKYKAEPDNYNASGETPLIKSMSYSDPYLFRGIMEARPSMDPVDLRGWNIAIYAVRYGLLMDVVDHLKQPEDNPDNPLGLDMAVVNSLFTYQDPQGYTALHHAVIIQNDKYVEQVLKLNIESVNARDANGNQPIHHAALAGNLHIMQVVAQNAKSLDVKNNFGETPLLLAAQSGNLAQVLAFLNNKVHIYGASAEERDNQGRNLLMMACIGGSLDLVNILLSQMEGDNRNFSFAMLRLNEVDKSGCSALMHAAREGNWNLIANLAIANANLLIQDKDGYSCLHYAAEQGEDETALALIDAQANVNLRDAQGWTPLMHAVVNEYHTTVALLCDSKADIWAENFHGATALTMANKSTQACLEFITDRMRQDDHGAPDPIEYPRLARVECNGHLMITIQYARDLWLEGVGGDDLNTYCVIQIILNDNKCENVFSVCFMGSDCPMFAETFRFNLPYVGADTKIAVHLIATRGTKTEVEERMQRELAPPPMTKAAKDAAKAKNALLKKFHNTQGNVSKERGKQLEAAQARAQEGVDAEVVKMELHQRRWHWVELLWRHADMGKTPLPPVSREDFPLGFVVVHPNTMRQIVQNCEMDQPYVFNRALRGSSRGTVNFELDFRRHFRPPEMPDPGIPIPKEQSFYDAPQPPLERLVYLKMAPKDAVPTPTTPWGTLPPPPIHAPAHLYTGDGPDPLPMTKVFDHEGPAG
jgi:ankyrin repeat protein